MNLKAIQILIVVAAVLCAVGVAALLGKNPEARMPDDFEPPGWISLFEDVVPRPSVARQDIVAGGRAIPQDLRLAAGRNRRFEIKRDPDRDVRELAFEVLQGRPEIIYEPKQEAGKRRREPQTWPHPDKPGAKPEFVIYSTGGTLTIKSGAASSTLKLEE